MFSLQIIYDEKMQYDPHMALELKLTQDEILAYQLACVWIKLTRELLPDYRHPKIAKKGDIRKTIIFKHMLKFVTNKKNEFKGFQFILYMRAQLEIAKKLQSEGKRILVDASILHGEKAQARYVVWKHLLKQKRKQEKAVYAFVESSVVSEFEKTAKTLNDILKQDNTFENYKKEASNILKYVILKKISPLYVVCSNWIKQLPEIIKKDIYDLSNIENLQDFDISKLMEFYNKYFPYET